MDGPSSSSRKKVALRRPMRVMGGGGTNLDTNGLFNQFAASFFIPKVNRGGPSTKTRFGVNLRLLCLKKLESKGRDRVVEETARFPAPSHFRFSNSLGLSALSSDIVSIVDVRGNSDVRGDSVEDIDGESMVDDEGGCWKDAGGGAGRMKLDIPGPPTVDSFV